MGWTADVSAAFDSMGCANRGQHGC
jgi:hypothetical protein